MCLHFDKVRVDPEHVLTDSMRNGDLCCNDLPYMYDSVFTLYIVTDYNVSIMGKL